MVIFKIFMDIVKIGWVRVIYDGSGNFQVFSGFLWPKLRVPHCTVFAPRFHSLKVFFLETSCYKTVVAKKFEVLLYTLELTRIFPKEVTKLKNRQIFTFCQF